MFIRRFRLTLGSETDKNLFAALKAVLQREQATVVDHKQRHGGSQDVETWKVRIGGATISIESETYTGLSISGPRELVESLSQKVRIALAAPGDSSQ